MALNAYLTMATDALGEIVGPVTKAGLEETIEVLAYSHEIDQQYEPATGLPTANIQHKSITICKEIDMSSPILFNILDNNDTTTEWRLDFYRPVRRSRSTRDTVENSFYSVEIEDASIINIRTEMLNNRAPENRRQVGLEYIQFIYQTISWTWQDGGIEYETNWSANT